MSPRIIQIPLSGGGRKHFHRELEKARRAQADLARQNESLATVVRTVGMLNSLAAFARI